MDMKTITLTDHELVHIINSLEVALVKVKNVEMMRSLYRLCREEGFNSVKIHHIGGLWLWVQFETLDSCNAFKNNIMLKSLFTKIKPVSRNFCVEERMVWVEISGLPLCAWGSNAFKKIVASVGKFMSLMMINRYYEMVRVCIAVQSNKFISLSGESDSDSKVDIESNNEVDSENEGDLHGLFQEEQKEEKFLVWNRLLEFIRNHEGQLVLFGDMNEVRDESERYGTVFSRVEAQMFNSFVDDAGIVVYMDE
ncbi:RNA-directed DNA polymerase, eukaryota [Tanacetum coccineum]|uniref:RNA-directed DNA polymerase, eukaryota n=1 Tax=Tanacetum coccineum TaxID=301880 RepID=A0ABQ5GQB5_9ASTR